MVSAHLPEPAPTHLRPSRFSHLILQTPQFPEMTAWYKTALSAEPMFENAVVCFLSYDEEHHRIMIGHNPNATPRDPKAAGVVHFAYAVETLDDLVHQYLRLKSVASFRTAESTTASRPRSTTTTQIRTRSSSRSTTTRPARR
jgi:catechol-2,3-dioxygenase